MKLPRFPLLRWTSSPPGREGELAAERERLAMGLLAESARMLESDDSRAILRHLCATLVELAPPIRLAWVWCGPEDTDQIRPQVIAGPASAYAETLVMRPTLLSERGPALWTLSQDKPDATHVSSLARHGSRPETAREQGFRAAMSLPLRPPETEDRGILVLYSNDKDYFRRIGTDLLVAASRLCEVALAQEALRGRLVEQSRVDPLTGVLNRRAGAQDAAAELARARRYGRQYAVALVDIDHFTSVDARHAHAADDRALRALARAARDALREFDRIVRWGGEELLVVFPETTAADAARICERIRATVADLAHDSGDGGFRITVSIGVAEANPADDMLESVLARAEAALNVAKRAGHNCVRTEDDLAAPDRGTALGAPT